MGHESDGDTSCNWCTRYIHQRNGKGTVGLGNKSKRGDYGIIKIGQNTENSPADLRRLALTQILVENDLLTLV